MKALAPALLLFTLATGLLTAAEEASFDKVLSISGPVDLDVKTDSGGITVRHGSAGSVKIHAILRSNQGWFGSGDVEARMRELVSHPPVEQTGNHVRVGYVHDRALLRGISMRLEIETPAETELRAHADSGGVHVEGIRGPVECKTDSGGIEISEIAADVHAAADSGGIRIRNVKGSLSAHADSGGIDATDVAGSIDASADSGHVRLSQTKAAPIRAKTDSGGVTVTLVRGAGYDINANVDSGRISTPEMTVQSSFSRHHVEGKVRGGGPLVEVHADSGSVTID